MNKYVKMLEASSAYFFKGRDPARRDRRKT